MKKSFCLLALCLSLLLCACSTEASQASPAEASPDLPLYREDVQLLWDILDNDYPYLPYLESRGADLAALRQSYDCLFSSVTDENEFAALIRQLFSDLGNFAHLDLVSPDYYQSLYYSLILDEAVSAEAEFEPFRRILCDWRLSSGYLPPQSAESFRQGRDSGRSPSVQVLYYPDCKALHLHITSFAQEYAARDRNIVAEALAKYPDCDHIIFDICGNTGGSDWYWAENLVTPFGGSWEARYRTYFRSDSRFSDYYEQPDAVSVSELGDVPQWVRDLGLDRCCQNSVVLPEMAESSGTPVETSAKRWLLVDGMVFSAADKFTNFCRDSGWATVVGTRTRGDGLAVMPALFLLPQSGLLIRCPVSTGENPDGSMNAAGTAPDILCLRDQTPLNRCLELIRSGSDGGE